MKIPSLAMSRIALSHIDFDDRTYSLRPEGDDELPANFLGSLTRCGLLHPPLVQDRGNDRFLIVSGRRRLRAVRDVLREASCICLIMPGDSTNLEALRMALEEGLLGPPWSPVMKANYLKKIVTLVGQEETVRSFLPRLDITPQQYHLDKLLSLAELEAPLPMAIQQGRIAEKTAYELGRLSFRDRLALFDLIISLKLSVGNQRQIIAICNELAKRSSTTVHTILTAPDILEILNSKDCNPPQQTARLMKVLQARRSPRLTAANQEFADLQNRLNLPQWAEISHSPSFEKDQVSLHLNFANQKKLEKFCRRFLERKADLADH